jgi:hypothetical protein
MHRVCRLALAAFVAAAPAMAETFVVQPDLALHGDRPFEAQVAAHPGDAIRVDLPALAGTGYSWAATVAGDAVQADGSEKREAVRPGGPTRGLSSSSRIDSCLPHYPRRQHRLHQAAQFLSQGQSLAGAIQA